MSGHVMGFLILIGVPYAIGYRHGYNRATQKISETGQKLLNMFRGRDK